MNNKTGLGVSYEKVLCAECMSLQEYEIKSERATKTVNGVDYTFTKKVAYCKCCGNKVYVPGLDDENVEAFEAVFRAENGYIQICEIRDILEKYDIEKRPLSKALGMGEHTIEKYLAGQLPNKNYSDRLKRVLRSYLEMNNYFNDNRDKLTDKAVEKLEAKLGYYKSINEHQTTIEKVALYILNSSYEITNMSLQKLLYYIEGFTEAMLGEQIYNNRCEAWMYGPVYPEIYEKYKSFGGNQIIVDAVDLSAELEDKYRKVIDYVLKLFGIFNGFTLKELSHNETPWKEAHKGYAEGERCEEVITHDAIKDYFLSVDKKYDIKNEAGAKAYIVSLGVI